MTALAHVIALDPTVEQANALARAAGTARFTYNWALNQWNTIRKQGGKPKLTEIKKQFNATKRELFPWITESPRDANSQPFADLQTGFTNFFASISGKRKGPKVAHPTFHKRGRNDSFYVANDKFHFDPDGKHVVLPVIGSVRIRESLRLPGKILSGRVRRTAGRWTISVQVEGEFRRPNTPTNEIVGVDLGLKTAIVASTGETISAPKPLKRSLRVLRRANKRLHRRTKGGRNRKKAQVQVAKTHYRISNIRKDFMHKATTHLARQNQTVVIEDLNVAGMLKNHKLARAIADVGFGMFRRFLEYKMPLYSGETIVANRWFPSSKRCHICGSVKPVLGLGERTYCCDVCGLEIDRDVNAAMNLELYPRLSGNTLKGEKLTDTGASTRRLKGRRASSVVDVGTESVAL